MRRYHTLDYLRGLAAFGIMIYHYLSWSFGWFPADSFFGRLGLYGVSIFYVLSGLTLYLVYHKRFNLLDFSIKRAFRIMPLLWLIIGLTIFINGEGVGTKKLLLNLTGLFGFITWDEYIGTGVWSIGNELVFYTFFPLFIFLLNRKVFLYLFAVTLFGIYCWFAFYRIHVESWKVYVNPLNQVFLFVGGFLLGVFFKKINQKNNTTVLILAILLFIFYPAKGDAMTLVMGVNRLVFTALSFIICFCVFNMTYQLTGLLHKILSRLGEASYSVYLIHPIVWFFVSKFIEPYYVLPVGIRIIFCLTATLTVSYITYFRVEKYFMQKGKDLSAWANKPSVAS